MAQRERIDLIIMGARGLTPTKEFVFGSVSHGVVTHAPGAVLTVPAPYAGVTEYPHCGGGAAGCRDGDPIFYAQAVQPAG